MMTNDTNDAPVPVARIDRLAYASDILEVLMVLLDEGSLVRLLIAAAKAEVDFSVTRAHADLRSSLAPPQH